MHGQLNKVLSTFIDVTFHYIRELAISYYIATSPPRFSCIYRITRHYVCNFEKSGTADAAGPDGWTPATTSNIYFFFLPSTVFVSIFLVVVFLSLIVLTITSNFISRCNAPVISTRQCCYDGRTDDGELFVTVLYKYTHTYYIGVLYSLCFCIPPPFFSPSLSLRSPLPFNVCLLRVRFISFVMFFLS